MARLLLLALASALVLGGAQLSTARPALALGPGAVCVFEDPNAAMTLGHTGWGYRIGNTNQWIYGATENFSNLPFVAPNHDIGYWDRVGTGNQMINAFHDPSVPTSGRKGVGRYLTFKCFSTGTSDVTNANIARHKVRCGGYGLATNNSLVHTYNVLFAYYTSTPMPSPIGITPNSWYAKLTQPAWTRAINLVQLDSSGSGADPGGSCP